MGRHGYSDDCDDILQFGQWRGQVASAIRGKRGQEFLQELVKVLESMPQKRLIKKELVENGEFCTLGAIGAARGIKVEDLDPYDYDDLAKTFGIAHQLVQEIEFENDENGGATPEERWQYMHKWVTSQLKT